MRVSWTNSEYAQKPFVQFLASQGLEGKLASIITCGLIFEILNPEDLDTKAALSRARDHLKSVGRYGKSAFLTAMYGTTSELCQCFCR
jgi:Rab proteins geranylgeranyltransferase component A